MDATVATVISALSAAVAALFGALMLTMRQSREDWKSLYDGMKKEVDAANHELRQSAATNAKLVETSFLQALQQESTRSGPHPQNRRASDAKQ